MHGSDLHVEVEALRDQVALMRRGRRRLVVGAVVLAIVAALPGIVVAAHRFTDVPTTNTFHANIDNLRDAGITTGCSPTTYCPNDPVTRGQMAAFLNRGLGRAGMGDGAEVPIADNPTKVASATMKTVGAGYILASVSSMAYTSDPSGCPCSIDLQIEQSGDWSFYFRETMSTGQRWISMGNEWVFDVDAAGTYTFDVWMTQVTGVSTIDADAVLTLLYVPFDETGAANDDALTTSGQDRQRARD